jgi:hypothetical protein
MAGVPVERRPGPVVPHRRAGISVGCGFLDAAQRRARVERGGDECVPQRGWTYRPANTGHGGCGRPTSSSTRQQRTLPWIWSNASMPGTANGVSVGRWDGARRARQPARW